jgi:hypothetical protein
MVHFADVFQFISVNSPIGQPPLSQAKVEAIHAELASRVTMSTSPASSKVEQMATLCPVSLGALAASRSTLPAPGPELLLT